MAERSWETLEAACHACQKCKLWERRTHVVIGKGNRNADILFIGEGPGQQEDLQGVPFVGPAGQLLDKMLASVGLSLEDAYIANVVKCRPPGNRDPQADETAACLRYLRYQLLLIQPKIIVCLGRIAATTLIDPAFKITRQRGEWLERKGYYMTATYHPSALLRDETKKRPAWEDMKAIRAKLDEIRAQQTAQAEEGKEAEGKQTAAEDLPQESFVQETETLQEEHAEQAHQEQMQSEMSQEAGGECVQKESEKEE